MSKVVMKDIAKALDVSIVAVSKALNEQKGISEELRKKIKSKALEMGYIGSGAKLSNNNEKRIIGVIIPKAFIDKSNNYPIFYLDFYQIISEMLQEKGYYTILHTLSKDYEDNCILPTIITEKMVDGVIFLAELSKDYLETVNKLNIPKVFVDFYGKNTKIDCVTTDNYLGSYEITSELLNNGHREIGFIGTLGVTSSIDDRYLGYQKALMERSIEINKNWILKDRDNNNRFTEIILPEKLPSAFVCNSDRVAYDLIKVAKSRGVKIPQELSVVGFDDDPYSRLCDPQITTVSVNKEEMVKRSIEFLLKKIKDNSLKLGKVSIKGTLIHRESVMEK